MSIKISGGIKESGIVIGNAYDKYNSANPIVKRIMQGFASALQGLVDSVEPISIHEVGCGEGYWTLYWADKGVAVRGSDFSHEAVAIAKSNASEYGQSEGLFAVKSIYDLEPQIDSADLIVCCEVMEHLEDPKAGLIALQGIVERYLILSVPREPIWCALNLARGKYIRQLGNTPGHIQHWSKSEFLELVSKYFDIVEVRSPFPWTMCLCRPLPVV